MLIIDSFSIYMQVSIHVHDQYMWTDQEAHGRGATCLYLWPMSCIVVFRAYIPMLLVHLELMYLDP